MRMTAVTNYYREIVICPVEMEITFVVVREKKRISTCEFGCLSEMRFKLDFSQPFLTKTNGSFSQRENVWRTTEHSCTLVSGVPTHVVATRASPRAL